LPAGARAGAREGEGGGADRGGRRRHRPGLGRRAGRARPHAGRGGAARVRRRAPRGDGAVVAGLRLVRHVPGLRGPRPAVQGRGHAPEARGGAHVSRGDRWLLVLPLALTAVGLVMVYSSSAILGITRYQDPDHFLMKQLLRVALGLGVFAAVSLRADLRRIEQHAPQLLVAAAVLLGVVVVGGHAAGGAMRWIRLGTLTLQPTDVARLS